MHIRPRQHKTPRHSGRKAGLRLSIIPVALSLLIVGAIVGNSVHVDASSSVAGVKEVERLYDTENDPLFAGPAVADVDTQFATPQAARKTISQHDHAAMMNHDNKDGMNMDMGESSRVESTGTSDGTAASLDPAVYGRWNQVAYPTKAPAIHVTYLRTGKFLLVSGSGNDAAVFRAGTFSAHVWNPKTGAMKSVPPPYDMFCSGHVVLPNGNVMIAGGTQAYNTAKTPWKGAQKAYLFDVAAEKWVALKPMRDGRWYPTNVLRGDGQVDVFAGRTLTGTRNLYPERYNPATNTWKNLPYRQLPDYPGLKRMADGRYVYSGARFGPSKVNPSIFNADTKTYTALPGITLLAQRDAAATVLAAQADKQWLWLAGGGFPATNSTVFVDLKAAKPAGVPGPKLPTAKAYVSALNLPNFEILETGGGSARNTPVYETSIFNAYTKTIRNMAPNTIGRTYHSSAALMEDGRVVTFGGDPTNADFELKMEIYSPPYLFKAGARPAITSAPSAIRYGGSYKIGATTSGGATFYSASLLRPASVTHSTDANERAVRPTMTPVAGGVQLKMPTNREVAPPGWYMLFLQDSQRRISVAKWVHLY